MLRTTAFMLNPGNVVMRYRPDAFWNGFTLVTFGLCFSLTICLLLVAASAFAQDGAGAAPAEGDAKAPAAKNRAPSPASDDGAEKTVVDLIIKSGWLGITFMAALGLFSLVGVAVAIERMMNLRREKILPKEFARRLEKLSQIQESRPDIFRELCEDYSAPAAVILRSGLLRAKRPLPEVEKAMEDAALREMASLRSRARPLGVIGSVAPLVGLLGTVVGMIMAFQTASQEGTGKAELLAEGIYLALLTTAAGLSIAIPCLLLAAYFHGRAEKFMREIDEQLMEVMPCFAEMEQARPSHVESMERNPDTTSAD